MLLYRVGTRCVNSFSSPVICLPVTVVAIGGLIAVHVVLWLGIVIRIVAGGSDVCRCSSGSAATTAKANTVDTLPQRYLH